MNRLARTSAAVVAALAVACLPATALADSPGAPVSLNNTTTSIVSGDVFGAGHSNIVGSGDGTDPGMIGGGVGGVAPVRVTLDTGSALPPGGAQLVASDGAEYPRYFLRPNERAGIAVSGPSFADYRFFDGGTFHIELKPEPGDSYDFRCQSAGTPRPVTCMRDQRDRNTLRIDGSF